MKNKIFLTAIITLIILSTWTGGVYIYDSLSVLNDVSISSPTNNQILKYNSSTKKWYNGTDGGASALTDLTDVSITSLINAQILLYDSASKKWKNGAAPAGGITTFNTLTGATQTLANGTTGTAPAFVSAGTAHTLNIPMASGAGVTAGLISKTEYDTFNGKQASGSYEVTTNKETGAAPTDSTSYYPSSHTVYTALAGKQASGTYLSTASILTRELIFSLEGLTAVETAFGSLYMHDGTNFNIYSRAFDQTTQEYSGGKFKVPANIGTGTVTFYAYIAPATGAASKYVQLSYEQFHIGDNTAWDAAMTAFDSGDIAITATTGNITVASWTSTVAALGWVANDIVYFRISRKAPSGTNLTGDMYWHYFVIAIPVVAT